MRLPFAVLLTVGLACQWNKDLDFVVDACENCNDLYIDFQVSGINFPGIGRY